MHFELSILIGYSWIFVVGNNQTVMEAGPRAVLVTKRALNQSPQVQ